MIGHDLRNPLQGLHYIVDLQKLRFERIRREHRGVDDWKNEKELFEALASRSSSGHDRRRFAGLREAHRS